MSLMAKTPTGATNGAGGKAPAPVRTQPQFVGSTSGQALTFDPPAEPPVVEEAAEVEPEVDEAPQETQAEPPKAVLGHGGKEMSAEAIAERVERANKKLLRELTGTDNIEEAKKLVAKAKAAGKSLSDADAKEFDRLKRLEEVRKRSRMTDEQRRADETKQAQDRIAALEAQLKERDQGELIRKQDQTITEMASSHIEPTMMKYAKRDFAEHLTEMQKDNPEQLAKFGPKEVEKWFKKYAVENPTFAKKAPEPAKVEKKPEASATEKRVVTTTKQPPRPPTPALKDGPGMYKGKTVKPGQPNSMNKAELREYAKANNIRLNY